MMRAPVRPLVGLLFAVAVIGACADQPDNAEPDGVAEPDAAAQPADPSEPNGASRPDDDSEPDEPDAGLAGGCRAVETGTAGRVERVELIEASGVVASRRHDGVLWAHNDSGRAVGVYAFDAEGNDLGFFELAGPDGPVTATDVEDIAIIDGTIYLADIGDNQERRSSITIHLFDEPTPGADGVATVGRMITARYPDGPTDAEAMIVDPVTGRILILSKDLEDGDAPTRLYLLDPNGPEGSGEPGEPVELEPVGSLDVAELTSRSSVFSINGLLFPGSVTAADITATGDLIALRTYGSVWLFGRTPGQTVVDALAGEPCEGPVESEAQGESIGFLPDRGDDDGSDGNGDTIRYVTVSEGSNPPVNIATVKIGDVGQS